MSFRMMSYADNHEDVLLQRAFDWDSKGIYIDVGAYDPVDHSVTKHFYDRGWWGINIEPNPGPFESLRIDRKRDINLNVGLSNRDGRMTVYEAPGACWSADRRLLTGFFEAEESEIIERSIEITTLAAVCARHLPGLTVDFLKIDVEGHEQEVIEGGDWSRFRPRLVLAEALGFEAWEGLLLRNGYHFALFDGVNRFYVREEDIDLMLLINYPANASDCFSIHGYARRISELEISEGRKTAELADLAHKMGQYGPMTHALACRVGKVARRFPTAAKFAKKIVKHLGKSA